MMHTQKKWFVIINPSSGNGSGKRKWLKVQHLLKQHEFNFDYAFTEYPKHSITIVHKAIKQNIKNIICVGGDGTLHNIINGVMTQRFETSSNINVGVIPIGTGNDWVKTHGISRNISTAIQVIKKGHSVTQDVGVITFKNNAKPPVYFNNLAGIGFDGFVVSKVEKYKYLGSVAYLLGALFSLFSFKNFESKAIFNSKESSGKTLMILIGLCKFSGGGMQLTKTPDPFDGLFDVSIVKNLSKLEIIKNLTKLFNGKITSYKKVKPIKTSSIKIKIKETTLPYIQADGELIGQGDILVTLIPKAFSFYTT